MAISAYDPEGRLKKHPLLGTSLAVDPKRSQQREQFRELHTEAMKTGQQGRTPMKERLTKRFQEFGGAQTQRLGELASRRGSLAQMAGDARNIEEEKRLTSNVTKYSNLYEPFAKEDLAPDELYDLYAALPKDTKRGIDLEWTSTPKQERQSYLSEEHKLGASAIAGSYLQGQKADAEKAQASYLERFNSEVDRLNQQYIPIQEEEIERQKKLQDRIELYNLFLGT